MGVDRHQPPESENTQPRALRQHGQKTLAAPPLRRKYIDIASKIGNAYIGAVGDRYCRIRSTVRRIVSK